MKDAKTIVIGTLATDAFIVVNKKVLRFLEGDGTLAIVLCELISIYKYMLQRSSVDELDSFPLPIEFLKKNLGLSSYKQKRALDKLQALGFLITAREGMPARRKVALNFDSIALLLDEESARERKERNKSSAFYNEINSVCNEDELDSEFFHEALDNIQEPLAGCMFLTTRKIRKESKLKIEWTPAAIGTLKAAVNYYNTKDSFDYGRFQDLLQAVQVDGLDFQGIISGIFNARKRIAERSPLRREYSYE